MSKFLGKKVVITGAGRIQSLGCAVAMAFAKKGADIIIAYHSATKEPAEIIDQINAIYKKQNYAESKAKAIQADLSDEQSREHFIQESYQFLDDIDILVNNAGIATRKLFIDSSPDDVKKIFDINFFAPFFLMQTCARHMIDKQAHLKKQNASLKDYSLINITSISQKVITPTLPTYEASKAALSQLTKAVAMELAKFNIRVNDISPGLVATNIHRAQWENDPATWQKRIDQIPLHRTVLHEDIAQAVLFAAGNTSMTGSTITVDGGSLCNWSGREINFNS